MPALATELGGATRWECRAGIDAFYQARVSHHRGPPGGLSRMRRRDLILLIGSAMITARALRAQQKALPVIGFLGVATAVVYAPWIAAFRRGLDETGYV